MKKKQRERVHEQNGAVTHFVMDEGREGVKRVKVGEGEMMHIAHDPEAQ